VSRQLAPQPRRIGLPVREQQPFPALSDEPWRRCAYHLEPWFALCEEAIVKGFRWLELPEPVPRRELAYAFVTFYLGVNLMTHLDEDRARADALFARLAPVAPLLASSRIRRDG
jgi:hypothetical protein